jgi:hypothetical protein
MSKPSPAKEETPIRGPAWSNAPVVVDSIGVEVRETKGLAALQQQFNGIYDQLKKGLETESHAAVDSSAQASKSNLADCDSSKKVLTPSGAFDFLDDRK